MSAKPHFHAPVRVLIAEASENSAHEYDSMLRDAGISTRVRLTDLDGAATDIATADVMLCNASLPRLELILPQLASRAPYVPIILVNPASGDPARALQVAAGMGLGAADVVSANDRATFVLVFKRELAHACQGQRLLETRRTLKETEQRCQLLLASSRAAIAYVHEGMHIHANAGYLKLFGFADEDALLGVPLMDLLSSASAEALKLEMKRLRQDDAEPTLAFSGTTAAGEPVCGVMTLAIANYEGERCMQVTVRPPGSDAAPPGDADAAPLDAAVAPMDPDGEPVHTEEPRVGVQHFVEAAATCALGGGCRAVLVAQLDGYSGLQEALGLRGAEAIGLRIHEALTQQLGDWPCIRLGPHQFAFTLADDDPARLQERLESLRRNVESLPPLPGAASVRTSLSIGGAEIGAGASAEGLEKALDVAFAAAVRAAAPGGARLEFVPMNALHDTPVPTSGGMLKQITHAIDNDRFQLLFQPIISLRGEAEQHYEAFLRMLEADGRQLRPDAFLPVAVAHDIAGKIDRWVILQSIKMISSHRASGQSTRLTVTVTANSVRDPEFPQWLGVALKAARLPSDAIIFQVTEQDAAAHMRETREFLTTLKTMHCRTSLSRFGIIDQPMELLGHMPVDFVKLDGSHVARLADDARRKEQLTTTIRDLQAAGKLTVIPMVESAATLSSLWQAGANYIQGHYLQEPSSEMDFDFSNDD
jgi:multidomain signaling protein FimX